MWRTLKTSLKRSMTSASIFSVEFSLRVPEDRLGDPVFSEQFGRSVKQCPVLHFFGYTPPPHNQSVCVHLHGILPYFFVPQYDGALGAVAFGAQLEKVALSTFRLAEGNRIIHHIELVKGIPFYGYCESFRVFYKIFVYSPFLISRLANLLGSTSFVGGRRWQPYEGHVPYHFQAMMDHGISGMSFLKIPKALVRQPLPRSGRSTLQRPLEDCVPLPTGILLHPVDVTKITCMDLEFDVRASDCTASSLPGASLMFVKSLLRSYISSVGKPLSLLDEAIADPYKRCSVESIQNSDPFVVRMKERRKEIAVDQTDPADSGSCVAPTPSSLPTFLEPCTVLLSRVRRTGESENEPVANEEELVSPTFNMLAALGSRSKFLSITSSHSSSEESEKDDEEKTGNEDIGKEDVNEADTDIDPQEHHSHNKLAEPLLPEASPTCLPLQTAVEQALQQLQRDLPEIFPSSSLRNTLPLLTTVTARHPNKDPRAQGLVRQRVAMPSSEPHSDLLNTSSKIAYLRVAFVELIADVPPSHQAPRAVRDRILVVSLLVSTSELDRFESHVFTSIADRAFASPERSVHSHSFANEGLMLRTVLDTLLAWNPDVLLSWDLQRGGLAFLAERARVVLGLDVSRLLSRFVATAAQQMNSVDGSESETEDPPTAGLAAKVFGSGEVGINGDAQRSNNLPLRTTQLKIQGRVAMSMWKVVRSELKLKSYTIQAIHQEMFGSTFPLFHDAVLAKLARDVSSDAPRFLASWYVFQRACISLRIARKLDLLVRTAELAQIYGILFFEVLSRGSQFRVESVLHRYAKPLGYVLVSPSREQVMHQNRQEGIALVMEPHSGFYTDPVLVLDFRSLYPSIVIAYNLCYSTLLGKVSERPRVKIGAISGYKPPDRWLKGPVEGKDPLEAIFAPNSAAFVSSSIREGILPKMLNDILNTRFQVQAAMKIAGALDDDEQRRVFDAQQIGLKLLANVTYGYAAATFTGRMPCSDIADAIVLLGRQTLERAIRTIEGTPKWQAKVIYGDTDSLFVRLPSGTTKDQAFDVANDIVRCVNEANPPPVTLKFEKVYLPCFMVVKKRYVGYAWESKTQSEPKFDAKGIETVRRDQCFATSQIMTECLRILFDTHQMGAVKRYFLEQAAKLQRGDLCPTNLILRREVKLGTYAKESTLPPGARVALQLMASDPATAPVYGERVPYVVVKTDALQLKDMVLHPDRLLQEPQRHELNSTYYMEKHIAPSLNRIFHMLGIDVLRWLKELPRPRRRANLFNTPLVTWQESGSLVAHVTSEGPNKKSTIDEFYQSAICAVCRIEPSCTRANEPPVCRKCADTERANSFAYVARKCFELEVALGMEEEKCRICCGGTASSDQTARCMSLDCGTLFSKVRTKHLLQQYQLLKSFLCVPYTTHPVVSAPVVSAPCRPRFKEAEKPIRKRPRTITNSVFDW